MNTIKLTIELFLALIASVIISIIFSAIVSMVGFDTYSMYVGSITLSIFFIMAITRFWRELRLQI